MRNVVFGIAAAILFPTLASAQTQPFRPLEAPKAWSANVGGGAVYGFSPTGKKAEQINVTPWADFTWGDRVYGNPLDGLGYHLVAKDAVRIGVQLRPRYSGQSQIEGLELPKTGADAAVYGFVRLAGNISVGGRVMQDVTGETDGTTWFGSVAHQAVTPVGALQSTLYVRGGDRRTNQAYFAISQREAAITGLRAYDLGAGAQQAGAAFIMLTPLGDRWAVASFINVERALGDVADSPLMQARKEREMAYRAAFIVVRRFGPR